MVNQTQEKILQEANRKFALFQEQVIKEVQALKEKRDELLAKRIVIKESELPDDQQKRLTVLRETLADFETVYNNGQKFCNTCNEQIDIFNKIYAFNINFEDIHIFINLIQSISIPDVDRNVLLTLKDFAKLGSVTYPFKDSQMRAIDTKVTNVFAANRLSLNIQGTDYRIDKKQAYQMIMNALGDKETFIDYFTKNYNFMHDVCEAIKIRMDDVQKEIDDYIDGIKQTTKEELIRPIIAESKLLRTIHSQCEDVIKCALLFNDDNSDENLFELAKALKTIDVISLREFKILTHEITEDEEFDEEAEEAIETAISNLDAKQPAVINELEHEYFMDPNSHCLICFLGDEGDDIFSDLYRFLEKEARNAALKELDRIFRGYIQEEKFYVPFGKGPAKVEVNKKVNALLKPPYNFNYRRIGTSHDPFRIHAIHRHSKFFEDLNLGSGNIMFFGAVGPVFDDSKGDTYQRVGKRAINALGTNNNESILHASFDDIEHISRGYIPYMLLSENDKKRKIEGKLNGIDGATQKNRNIDDKYFLFDCLDEETQNFVKYYLNKYLLLQSTYMFNILREYEKIKDKSFN